MFNFNSVINSYTGEPYGIYMADWLCNVYHILIRDKFNMSDEKMGGEETIIHNPEHTHLRQSLATVIRTISNHTPTEKFIDSAYKEINNIKTLYENIPEYNVTIELTYPGYDFPPVEREYTVRTFLPTESNDFKEQCYLRRNETIKSIKQIK